jgi:hypothetical protein
MTQLEQFIADVVNQGAEKCLPRSLSDHWLRVVAQSADEVLNGNVSSRSAVGGGTGKPGAIALAAVLSILKHKAPSRRALALSLEEVGKHFHSYRIELALEEVHRNTDVKYEPATLDDMFTDRMVTTWKE